MTSTTSTDWVVIDWVLEMPPRWPSKNSDTVFAPRVQEMCDQVNAEMAFLRRTLKEVRAERDAACARVAALESTISRGKPPPTAAKGAPDWTELERQYRLAYDLLAAQNKRIAELAAAQRWQPMETAPREAVEGEEHPPRLLLYLDSCVCVGRWEPSISLWIVDGYTYRECAFKGWQYPPKGPEEHGC
jgi:hypothetical protein